MGDLLWPGDERAGELCTDAAVLAAMVAVEGAWLHALVSHGVAPADAAADLGKLVDPDDADAIAAGRGGRRQPGHPAAGPAARPAGASPPHAGCTPA